MRVLVTAGSRHGATLEIAEAIGRVLTEHGVEAAVVPAEEVDALDRYEAAVVGSAIYMGHWVDSAKRLVHAHRDELARRPVWIFSSGPLGDPPKPDAEQAVSVHEIIDLIAPREHRLFAGKVDTSLLGFKERAVMKAVRATEGDYREWEAIASWAASIAAALSEHGGPQIDGEEG